MRLSLPTIAAVVSLLALTAVVTPQGYPPDVAAGKMKPAAGLAVNLFAAEPNISQPILAKFDDRGRLWTIQYLQYPLPAGLKRVKVDRWSRAEYDRVPEPPPKGPRGADRITICEDTDGDGRADRFKDFVSGLNLCTGVAFGHGGVYVMQVPYLLFYPDRNRDDVPDSDPEVLLSGFGMEDAQSLANHLTFGPDGWLYGVTGSTSSNRVRGIEFQQAVWRIHPLSKKFELFCEGGGNLFGLTFDADGNLFFSSNGTDLGYHAVQGGYYRKNFGKHGPLHNPYTYGYFEHLPWDKTPAGPRPGGTIYLGDALSLDLRGSLFCCDFLQHSASWWKLTRRGSTFSANYGGVLLDSCDTWFCAPDLCAGPDGGVYVCDFHEQRTAHPDPDAKWDRSNGRIYRIAPPGTKPVRGLDLARKSTNELVDLLRHPNGWYAEQARLQLAARHDRSAWPALASLARQAENPRLALQGLWGLYVSGGFDDTLARELLHHCGEYVRAWTVRLAGDDGHVSPVIAARLAEMAASDSSPAVLCQLAATARRLPGSDGLAVVENMLRREASRDDPYLPLMIWWAIEAKALTDADRLVAFFAAPAAWSDAAMRENGLRLVRRYAAEGTRPGYEHCLRLLSTTPAGIRSNGLEALEHGLAERTVVLGGMGTAGLFESVATVNKERPAPSRRYEPLTKELIEYIKSAWQHAPKDATALRLAMRAGSGEATTAVAAEVVAPGTSADRRCVLLGLLAGSRATEGLTAALGLLDQRQPVTVQAAALDVLAGHGDAAVTSRLLTYYPKSPPALRRQLRDVLLGRPASARAFLERIDRKEIDAAEVPVDQLRQVALYGDQTIDALVHKQWGSVQPGTTEEKLAEIRRLTNDLRAGTGDSVRGKALFVKHCATCHKLFGEGGQVGPDLTGVARNDRVALLANIVDPSAVIRAEYLQYAALTTGGRTVTGVIVARDGASVTLADAQGKRTTLPRDQIEELRELPTSIMPENLLKQLQPQEVRDLFGYLQASAP
jgi:putative heme-binding domain-containing protein